MEKYKIQISYEGYGYVLVDADNPKDAYDIVRKKVNDANVDYYNHGKGLITPLVEPKNGFIHTLEDNPIVFSEDGEKTWDKTGEEWPCDDDFAKELSSEWENEKFRFIWGVTSYDELTSDHANLYTMNDIDVIFDKEKKEYFLGIEEIYTFNPPSEVINYLERLLKSFHDWMLNKYSEKELNNIQDCSIWEGYYPSSVIENIIPLTAKNLLDLYYKFFFFVKSYNAIWNVKEEYLRTFSGKKK